MSKYSHLGLRTSAYDLGDTLSPQQKSQHQTLMSQFSWVGNSGAAWLVVLAQGVPRSSSQDNGQSCSQPGWDWMIHLLLQWLIHTMYSFCRAAVTKYKKKKKRLVRTIEIYCLTVLETRNTRSRSRQG